MELRWRSRDLAVDPPLRAAWGELRRRTIIDVELRLASGEVGRGEAAPLEPYDGVSLGAVDASLDAYAAVLRALPDRIRHADVLDACAAERALPQALAAIDLALWDLAGRRARRPVAQLIDAGAARTVEVNATVDAADRAGAARAAQEAAAAGFGCVKLKVGIGDDAGRLAAVRAAVGPDVRLRADANGAWGTPAEALANLDALAPARLELCEEPVHGVAALAAVRERSPVPIAMDETAAEPGAITSGAADAVCLKISRCGGLSGLLAEARAARAAGADVYVASTWDGPLGYAAGLHGAAALAASGRLLPCGLATRSPYPVVRGWAEVPSGEGLAGR